MKKKQPYFRIKIRGKRNPLTSLKKKNKNSKNKQLNNKFNNNKWKQSKNSNKIISCKKIAIT